KYFQFSCFQTKRPGAGNRQSPSVSRACCPNEGARVCDPQQRGMVRESANSRRTISQPRPFFLPFDLGNTPFIDGSTSQYPQIPGPRDVPGSQHVENPILLEITQAVPPLTIARIRFSDLGNTPFQLPTLGPLPNIPKSRKRRPKRCVVNRVSAIEPGRRRH